MQSFPIDMTKPAAIRWRLETPAQVSVSPHTGASQTSGIPYQRWAADLSWPVLRWQEAGVLEDFLVRIGTEGFHFTPPQIVRRGKALGAPIADRVEDGNILSSGWRASVAGQLRQGDHIGVTDGKGQARLLRVLADVDSDASGQAAIPVAPRLAAITPRAVIRTASPRCVMRIEDSARSAVHYRGSSASADLKLVEAWPS